MSELTEYTISHIVAAGQNNVIGTQGDLPWDIPEDMRFFKDKTKDHALIMGRKTFEAVGHPLPNRLNVVITRQPDYKVEGAQVCKSIDDAIDYCKTRAGEFGNEIYIIGGGEIYQQSMDKVDLIYLTRIHQGFEGDTQYPDVNPLKFEEIERRERLDQPVPFTFLTYRRKADC